MRKRLINYTEDKVEIPSRLYSGLVRSLAWKIEYHGRIERAKEFMDNLDSLDTEQFYELEKILKGERLWETSQQW